MKFLTPNCPTCGSLAMGTVDTIPGVALLNMDEDGSAEFAGETDVCWDGQTTNTDDAGLVELQCGNGHTWHSDDSDFEPEDPALDVERGDGTTPRDDRAEQFDPCGNEIKPDDPDYVAAPVAAPAPVIGPCPICKRPMTYGDESPAERCCDQCAAAPTPRDNRKEQLLVELAAIYVAEFADKAIEWQQEQWQATKFVEVAMTNADVFDAHQDGDDPYWAHELTATINNLVHPQPKGT